MALVNVHITILILTVLVILVADHAGLRYFLGKTPTMNPRFVYWTHFLMWVGLLGMITTGFFLALPGLSYYLSEWFFRLKMGFVLTLILNAVVIGKLSKLATVTPFAKLSLRQKQFMILSAGVSALSWIGAILIGVNYL